MSLDEKQAVCRILRLMLEGRTSQARDILDPLEYNYLEDHFTRKDNGDLDLP